MAHFSQQEDVEWLVLNHDVTTILPYWCRYVGKKIGFCDGDMKR